MRIALIGSRQLEQKQEYLEDIKLCYNVCMRLAQLGITFTSGCVSIQQRYEVISLDEYQAEQLYLHLKSVFE